MSLEAVGGDAEVGHKLDEELVAVGHDDSARRQRQVKTWPPRQTFPLVVLPRRSVAAELPNPPGVVALAAVEQRHVVVAAVRVRLQVQLLELHLDHLGNERPSTRSKKAEQILTLMRGRKHGEPDPSGAQAQVGAGGGRRARLLDKQKVI